MKIYNLLAIFSFLTISACAQSTDRMQLGRQYAEAELKAALSGKQSHNVITEKNLIIKDSVTAIAVAEPILFGIYGENNITKQRPYEVYLIDTYWLITGTLPKGMKGGTFLIIIDATNSKVILITHGK
ncbi:MAG: YbbC/YhhH family protein [Bacteroidota bacterium]